jgi:hypothetical protein
MTAERRTRLIIVFLILSLSLCIAPASGFIPLRAALPDEISYFVGVWKVSIKGDPDASYKWTVTTDKNGSWLEGATEKNGEKIATEFWRLNGKVIERFAFGTDGSLLRIASAGWKTGTLIFTGIASGKTGEYRVKETITREGESKFHAVWEKQGEDGKWTTFSDESYTK